MQYAKIVDGSLVRYPYDFAQLRRDNKNVSFPIKMTKAMFEEWGMFQVHIEDNPTYNKATQKIVTADAPVLESGVWVIKRSVEPMTSEEIQQNDLETEELNRTTRFELLSETDWWASSDRTMSDEETAYRQALRDITTHANWPHLQDDDWPTKP